MVLVLALIGASAQALLERRDARAYPAQGELVDIGGRRLHLHVTGEDRNGPTVVMEAGLGAPSASWGKTDNQLEQHRKLEQLTGDTHRSVLPGATHYSVLTDRRYAEQVAEHVVRQVRDLAFSPAGDRPVVPVPRPVVTRTGRTHREMRPPRRNPIRTQRGSTMRTDCDVAIIGGGAGGLSAALVLARARRRVAVIDSGRPRNAPAAHLHGYLGRDGARPAELLSTGRAEAAGYGATFMIGEVRDVASYEEGFQVALQDGRRLTARRLLLATGLIDRLPDVLGLSERWARDVLHCPYCHGYEVADRQLGVLNAGPTAVHQATTVRHWSRDVILFTNGTPLDDEAISTLDALRIGVEADPITRLVVDDDRLTGVQLADGRVIARTAVFVAPNPVANDEPAVALGANTYQHRLGRFVVTDTAGRTSVPGVYAVGNVTDPTAQLITAAGDGSRAAIEINSDLIEEDATSAVRRAAGSDGSTAVHLDKRTHPLPPTRVLRPSDHPRLPPHQQPALDRPVRCPDGLGRADRSLELTSTDECGGSR